MEAEPLVQERQQAIALRRAGLDEPFVLDDPEDLASAALVVIPATAAPTAWCEYVNPWTKPGGSPSTMSRTAPEAATNPNGKYPDVPPFAPTRMSGRTPQWSPPNQRPVRPKPVITSSMMKRTS